MSKKIIGVTVGTQLPKPNFKQTDPTKGDYIKNKPDFDGLKSRVDDISNLVGDIAISDQINSALVNQAGIKTENGGEIFNDYENNTIEDAGVTNAYAHAEGRQTTAGWRSHTEGYMTLANSTSHAEGRLSQATGKGSHAEGIEVSQDVLTPSGDKVFTVGAVNIDENVITVNYLDGNLQIGDTVYLSPSGDATGFKSTDVKRVVQIDEASFVVWGDITCGQYDVEGDIVYNDVPLSPSIQVGSKIAFGETSEETPDTKDIYTVLELIDECTIRVDRAIDTTRGTTFMLYPLEEQYSVLTLHAPFRAENYYEGLLDSEGNIVCPEDGIIPVGAKLRKAIGTRATNTASHAEGAGTNASGKYSHTEGYNTEANADCAHAEGNQTVASGKYSHAEGSQSTSSGDYSHAEGYKSTASGNASHAEGSQTVAIGNYSHAEGSGTDANKNYSHAEGDHTVADGEASHAEGFKSTASGKYSHSEGSQSTASGDYSHAEGYKATANGNTSHAEGSQSYAIGDYSHVEGLYTIADGKAAHVQGRYSLPDDNDPDSKGYRKYAHIVGNGTSITDRSNAHTLDWDGNAWFAGEVTASSGRFGLSKKEGVITGGYSFAEGVETEASGYASHAEGNGTTASGGLSHTEGYYTTAYGYASHAEGETILNEKVFDISSYFDGIIYLSESVQESDSPLLPEGLDLECYVKVYANSEYDRGYSKNIVKMTLSPGALDKDAESGEVLKSGYFVSFTPQPIFNSEDYNVEGVSRVYPQQSIGVGSHTEGAGNLAKHDHAHVEGYCNESTGANQHVQGKWNDIYDTTNYAHVIGGGSETERKNIHTVDWDGNAVYAGEVTASNGRLISEDEARALIPEVDNSEEWYIIRADFTFGEEGQFITVNEIKFNECWPRVVIIQTNEDYTGCEYIYIPLKDGYEMPIYYFANGQNIISFVLPCEDQISECHLDFEATEIRDFMETNNPTGTGAFSLNRKSGTTIGAKSVSVGDGNTASGTASFAEGVQTTASGGRSHAEGYKTVTYGWNSHAEGNGSITGDANDANKGINAHAEGFSTLAQGKNSHAEGYATRALSDTQHVQGKYNVDDPDGIYAHIVGNGSESKPSNAHTLDWKGNAWYSGKVTAGAEATDNMDLATYGQMKKYVEDNSGGVGRSIEEGGEIFNDYENNAATGLNAHAEGSYSTASGASSHAEGGGLLEDEGMYYTGNIASGEGSHAEGLMTVASGDGSHAEGCGEIATYDQYGDGLNKWKFTPAKASGRGSHAEGWSTIAASNYQHAQGKWNIEDNENKYAHIVGNGTDLNNRSNAHTLDWQGNAWFKGNVYVGGTSQDDPEAKMLVTKDYVDSLILGAIGGSY